MNKYPLMPISKLSQIELEAEIDTLTEKINSGQGTSDDADRLRQLEKALANIKAVKYGRKYGGNYHW